MIEVLKRINFVPDIRHGPIRAIFCCIPLLICAFKLTGQSYSVSGKVYDNTTGESLPFASVFFSGSTYGTVSDANGKFTLSVNSPGTYDLVVSFSGFETFYQQLDLNVAQELVMDVRLSPKFQNLGTVVVTAEKDDNWERNLNIFKQIFLGTSRFARSCDILNEEVMRFYYDEETKVFEAYANEPIIIENQALGFQISYILEHFTFSFNDYVSSFYGFPSFEDMNKQGKSKKRWIKNRKEAYRGSITHFFRALFEGDLEEEGFVVNRAKDVEAQGRVMEEVPVNVARFIMNQSNGTTKTLNFSNYLYITYLHEKEAADYKTYRGYKTDKGSDRQLSWISMSSGSFGLNFEMSGYLINPLSIVSSGYWGFEKLGDMLPTDYEPERK